MTLPREYTLNYFTCSTCGLRAKVPRGPGDYTRFGTGDLSAAPEAAQECPRCGNRLNWHSSPVYAPYYSDDVERAYRLAQLSRDNCRLAWLATPLGHGHLDFAFACAWVNAARD